MIDFKNLIDFKDIDDITDKFIKAINAYEARILWMEKALKELKEINDK